MYLAVFLFHSESFLGYSLYFWFSKIYKIHLDIGIFSITGFFQIRNKYPPVLGTFLLLFCLFVCFFLSVFYCQLDIGSSGLVL